MTMPPGKDARRVKKLIDRSLLRFVLVGVVNTCVGTGIMFALYNLLHCGYWLSSAANYVVGSAVSYVLNKHFTFRSRERSPRELGRFVLNILVCYLLAYGIAKPAANALLAGFSLRVRENGAMLCGTGLFTLLNYFGQRFFVFRAGEDTAAQTRREDGEG